VEDERFFSSEAGGRGARGLRPISAQAFSSFFALGCLRDEKLARFERRAMEKDQPPTLHMSTPPAKRELLLLN